MMLFVFSFLYVILELINSNSSCQRILRSRGEYGANPQVVGAPFARDLRLGDITHRDANDRIFSQEPSSGRKVYDAS